MTLIVPAFETAPQVTKAGQFQFPFGFVTSLHWSDYIWVSRWQRKYSLVH